MMQAAGRKPALIGLHWNNDLCITSASARRGAQNTLEAPHHTLYPTQHQNGRKYSNHHHSVKTYMVHNHTGEYLYLPIGHAWPTLCLWFAITDYPLHILLVDAMNACGHGDEADWPTAFINREIDGDVPSSAAGAQENLGRVPDAVCRCKSNTLM